MYKLDFLSDAPKTLIFENNSNKSNIGGVFSLILFIIVFFIAFSFIYDYATGLKYSVIYTYDEEYLDAEEEKRKLQDERYNPEITYKFEMPSYVNASNFFIYTEQSGFFKFGEERKSKVYEFKAYIVYRCSKLGKNDIDCSLRESDKSSDVIYYFNINYTGTKIVHQIQELPLQEKFISDFYYFSFGESMNYYYQKWKTIKYKEDKGIFGALNFIGKSKEYYGGVMVNDKMAVADMPEDFINEYKAQGKKILCGIEIKYSSVNFLEVLRLFQSLNNRSYL